MQTDYADISTVSGVAEELPEAFVSSDYSNSEIFKPGWFTSLARTIENRPHVDKKTKKESGHITFTINFTGGLTDENGRLVGRGGYERTWVTTIPRAQKDKPGKISSAAEYLRACGIDPKDLGSNVEAIKAAMAESQNTPVQVNVGRRNKTEKNPETNEYTKEVCYTKDFNVGTREEPNFVTSITKDGVNYTAKHTFEYFRKVR